MFAVQQPQTARPIALEAINSQHFCMWLASCTKQCQISCTHDGIVALPCNEAWRAHVQIDGHTCVFQNGALVLGIGQTTGGGECQVNADVPPHMAPGEVFSESRDQGVGNWSVCPTCAHTGRCQACGLHTTRAPFSCWATTLWMDCPPECVPLCAPCVPLALLQMSIKAGSDSTWCCSMRASQACSVARTSTQCTWLESKGVQCLTFHTRGTFSTLLLEFSTAHLLLGVKKCGALHSALHTNLAGHSTKVWRMRREVGSPFSVSQV